MLHQWLHDEISLLSEDSILWLLAVFDFEQLTRVLDFSFKSQKLFEGMVEKYDFFCCFMGQDVTNFFKALWAFKQRHEEHFDVMKRPNITLFVLHLILKRVFDQFKLLFKPNT
jgi:hypothetical protein